MGRSGSHRNRRSGSFFSTCPFSFLSFRRIGFMGWRQKQQGLRLGGRPFARLAGGGRRRGSQVNSRRPLRVERLEMRRLLAASPHTAPPLLDSASADSGSPLNAVSDWSVGPHPVRVTSIEVTPTNEIAPYTTVLESGPSS